MLPAVTFRDPLEDLVLGYTLFDWKDPEINPNLVTARLCGFVVPWEREDGTLSYWHEVEYKGMSPLQIEKKILSDAKRANWWGKSKFGKPYFQHMLCLAKLMFPKIHITPTVYDVFNCFCRAVGGGNRKALHLIGSQNAGKSFGSCLLAFVCMFISPEITNCYIANPFIRASQSQEWGTCEELWYALIDAHPLKNKKGDTVCALFPKGVKYADKFIKFVDAAKAGKIMVEGIDDEGKFRGIKSPSEDVDEGVILLIVGEINLVKNHSFYDMIDNLASQDAFLAISSQNFRDIEDLGGVVTEPSGLFNGPKSFEELDIDKDQFWHGAKGSVVLRLDGHNSPNILADRTIYQKLFKKENLQFQLENGGVNSPNYFSQVRSFPIKGNENNSVLSKGKISQSRHQDPYYTLKKINGSLLFVDPAFGGQDQAVVGHAYFGEAETKDPDGATKVEELIIFPDYFHPIQLVKDAIMNDYWISRLNEAGIPLTEFTLGAAVSYEDQIAIKCKEYANKYNVKSDSTGFDSSMRPDIVSSMNKVFGFSVNAFDYNREPEGYLLQNLRANSKDVCKDRNTELAFLAADYFLTKQVRSGGFIETAILQLSRTHYETQGKKFKSEAKKEYKARFQNKSPDHRDVLVGLCGLAARKGFRQNAIRHGSNSKPLWQTLQEKNVGQGKRGIRI